jgi:glycosyltransferase involved in cell wall biosynthesis
MKKVLNLYKAIEETNFVNEQFSSVTDHNILFLTPQLTGKELYKTILPFFFMNNDEKGVYTNISGLEKYNPIRQLLDVQVPLTSIQILRSDFIVFPFTTQPIATQPALKSVYEQLRDINPAIKLVYHIDFNFYLLDKSHPYHSYFPKQVIEDIEDNIFYSDITLVTNVRLQEFLTDKFRELKTTKYKNFQRTDQHGNPTEFRIGCVPLFMDEEVLTENVDVDFEDEQAPIVTTPEPAANNPTAMEVQPVIQKPIEPQPLVKAKKIFDVLNKSLIASKIIKSSEKIISGLESAANEIEKLLMPKKEVAPKKAKLKEEQSEENSEKEKPLRVGIIATDNYFADLIEWKKTLQQLNSIYKSKITIVIFGLHQVEANKLKNGLNFEYHPPVSIIHYFKKLKSLDLDLLLIPLRDNEYNQTSENYNKFIEASLFKIPVAATDIFPYNQLIENNVNGFLLPEKTNIIDLIEATINDRPLLKEVGESAYKYCSENLSYTESAIQVLYEIYIKNDDSELNQND